MTIHLVLGITIIIAALFALGISNNIFDTETCKRNWIIVFSILIGALIVIENYKQAMIMFSILISGILTNYILQFLLNTVSVFNRKSDP